MSISPRTNHLAELPSFDGAAQHLPRPLPLLLQLLEREARAKRVDLAAALGGLKRYQAADRADFVRPPLATYAQHDTVRLLASRRWEEPRDWILMVPSIINGSEILDLGNGLSLIDWLAETHNVLLVDWGSVDAGRAKEDFEALIAKQLAPLVAHASSDLGRPPHLLGYCLGGMFALALSHLVDARSLALVATPWDFSAYPHEHLAALRQTWASQKQACGDLGLMPFELLQSGFWMLEPDRVAVKYAKALHMTADPFARFVRVEDWANGGQPLMLGAARDLMEAMVNRNAAAGGEWKLAGRSILAPPDALPCLSVRSTSDRIVPFAVSADFGTTRDVSSGHIGMMVGSKRREQLWQPLTDWFQSVHSRR